MPKKRSFLPKKIILVLDGLLWVGSALVFIYVLNTSARKSSSYNLLAWRVKLCSPCWWKCCRMSLSREKVMPRSSISRGSTKRWVFSALPRSTKQSCSWQVVKLWHQLKSPASYSGNINFGSKWTFKSPRHIKRQFVIQLAVVYHYFIFLVVWKITFSI